MKKILIGKVLPIIVACGITTLIYVGLNNLKTPETQTSKPTTSWVDKEIQRDLKSCSKEIFNQTFYNKKTFNIDEAVKNLPEKDQLKFYVVVQGMQADAMSIILNEWTFEQWIKAVKEN